MLRVVSTLLSDWLLYQSAMSMLTFYINRAGRKLPEGRRERLEAAKDELRKLFGRRAGQAT
jgi:hypothetical protein